MKSLRPYQQDCIDALFRYWQQPQSGDGVIVCPTGAGKSLIMAAIIKGISTDYPGTRILMLAHVRELLQQNYDELLTHWPDAPVGIYSAGLDKKEFHAQILIAGIQSIAKHTHKLEPAPEIVLIDECHLIPRAESTRYNSTIKTLKQMYPSLRVVGLSATPYRLDSGWLHIGPDALFDHIIHDVSLQGLIDQGYLCHVTTKATKARLNIEGVKHAGREFQAGDLEEHVMAGDITELAVADMVERAKDRRKWLVFACGIRHAEQINGKLQEHGIASAIITGDTEMKARDELIEAFKGNALEPLRCLVNVNVLTTGFNVPSVDFIALMRPTESVGLYVQMVGRGLRNAPGKTDCLVADYAGLTLRHGPIDAVDPSRDPTKGDGIPPAKECPECQTIIHASMKECPVCGFLFPEREVKIKNIPSEAPILKDQITEEEHDVKSTTYSLHQKQGKKDSVKITYNVGLGEINEWVFPESDNQWGAFFFAKFCRSMGLTEPYPSTAGGFIERVDLKGATRIWTMPEGKYTRVKRHEWGDYIKKVQYTDDIPF